MRIENNDKILFILILASCLSFIQDNVQKLQAFVKSKIEEFLKINNPSILENELAYLERDFAEFNDIIEKEVFNLFAKILHSAFESFRITSLSIENLNEYLTCFSDIVLSYYGEESEGVVDKLSYDLQKSKDYYLNYIFKTSLVSII